MVKILTVNLRTEESRERELGDPLVGGRLLSSQLVAELVPPQAEPLGPENILAFTCGPLAGLRVSTGGRLSVGAKSPLTRGIKEANAGGMAGDSLARLGYRALVLQDARPGASPALLILDEKGVRLADARPYMGLGTEALRKALLQEYGQEYMMIGVGPAGERRLGGAGIVVSDAKGKPFRLAARGGLGAVMGSKGVKAILLRQVDPLAPPSNTHSGRRTIKPEVVAFHRLTANNARVQVLREYGTASTMMTLQLLGGLPVRNFSHGALDAPESLSGETMRDLILERGGVGTPTEACMHGCVIQCSNIFPAKDGNLGAAPVEFETICLCGTNLGLSSFDEVARLNRLCNDLGLDTIETGAALGVMMEAAETGSAPPEFAQAGLPRFGDAERAAEILQEIPSGGRLGCLVGRGVVATGQTLGVKRIPAVKGQAMSAYDPRIVKGTGVTYATSPQGADHTAGLTLFAPGDHTDPTKAVRDSRGAQLQRAAYDALGLCVFNLGATGAKPDSVLDILRAEYGVALPEGWLNQWGRKVLDLERAFNRAAGLTPADDRLPEFFAREPLAPVGSVFDVSPDEMDRMWE